MKSYSVRRTVRKWVCVSFVLLALVALPVLGETSTLEKIVSKGVFEVGTVCLAPGSIKDPNTGEFSGYYVDAMEWIAEEMGVELVIREATWASIIAGLQSGQYDLSIAGTFATLRRGMAVSFTDVFKYNGLSAVTKDSPYTSIEDVNSEGVVVSCCQGSIDWEWGIRHLTNANLQVIGGDAQQVALSVQSGQSDVGLIDYIVAKRYVAAHPTLRLVQEQPHCWLPISWAARHGDHDLLAFINLAITHLHSRGILEAILRKYCDEGDAHIIPAIPTTIVTK